MEIGTVRVSPKNTTGCPYRTLIIQDDTVICLQGDKLITGGGLISCRSRATARSKEWEHLLRSALTTELKARACCINSFSWHALSARYYIEDLLSPPRVA